MKYPRRKVKRTKHGDYERVVKFPVWSGYQVHVIFTNDIAASRKARYGSAGASEGARALHSSAEGGHSHLFFRIGNSPAGVISHESWHAIRCMMVDFGGVTIMENEVTAYHLGYLTQEVVSFQIDLMDAKIGVKSSSRKKATHGNKDSQRSVAGMQGVPTHSRGVGTEKAGEAGTPEPSSQADGHGGDLGYRRETTGGL
jgi:hypothetical protein